MKRKSKYPVLFQRGNVLVKRSVTVPEIELLYILCDQVKLRNEKKGFADLIYVFPGDEIKKVLTIKNVPRWIYLGKVISK